MRTPIIKRLRSYRSEVHRPRSVRGAVLVEMAFVLPMLLLLLMGILWTGRAFNILATLHRAAREGARVAVTKTCASCGSVIPTDSDVKTAVFNSLSLSAIDTTKVQKPGSCSTSRLTEFCYQRDVVINSGTDFSESTAVVSLAYPVTVPVPIPTGWMRWHFTSITLNAQAQMREEY